VRTTVILFLSPGCDEMLASFSFMNQWVLRHSLRKVPLELSTKALSVGLLGLEKSIFAPF
jgi:hypothetical protein